MANFVGIKCLLVMTCLPYLFYNIIQNGLATTSVSAVQSRFQLQSAEVGGIVAMGDVGSIITLILVTIIGENVNKPRVISMGSVLIGIGAMLFGLPHFLSPPYEYNKVQLTNTCGNVTTPECGETYLRKYYPMFMVAMAIIGFGLGLIFAYGLTYIDDNSTTRQSSLYTAIFYLMAAIGPVIGFLAGGGLSEIFVELKSVDIDTSSPFWIGAWWPGYIACAGMSVMIAIPMFFMPKSLPNFTKIPEENNISIGKKCKRTVLCLIKNPIFVLSSLVISLNQAFVLGFNTFGVKYVEAQYGLSTFLSSMVFGAAGIIAITLAHITSGVILSKYDLQVQAIIKLCIASSIASVIFTFGFFFYCNDEVNFAGGTMPYTIQNSTIQLRSFCNEECGCSTDWYNPVQGSDSVVYFSPCFAGCNVEIGEGKYANCSCITSPLINNSSSLFFNQRAEDVKTLASEFCVYLIPFILITAVAFYTSVLVVAPNLQITLRCVEEDHRSSAVGTQQILALLVGNIPGRVLSGKVLDLACVVWSTKCDELASCKLYNKWDMALYIFLLLFVETLLILLIYVIMYFIYKPETTKEHSNGVDNNAFNENKEEIFKSTQLPNIP